MLLLAEWLLAEETSGSLLTFEPLLKDQGLALAVMGMTVVFLALVTVAVFITLLPRVMAVLDRLHPDKGAQAEQKKKSSKEKSVDADELSEETVVVIAAAVAAVLDQPHRIVRIRGLTPEDMGWALEGRMRHHTSHAPHQRG
ncbi:MAG: OadG family protein [Pirellulaceae bacterium]